MRYYRRRRKASQKAKTIFFRILFVLAAAAVITGLAVLTGNLLLARVQRAEEYLETSVPPSGNAAGRVDQSEVIPDTEGVYSSLQVYASGLDLTLHETADSLVSRIYTISQHYDTVSVSVSRDGGLLYTSPALSDLVRMPSAETTDPLYASLTDLCVAAKAQNLRISAVLESSLPMMPDVQSAALLDSTVAAELYTLGFDEIMLTGVLDSSADTDAINMARRYLLAVQSYLAESTAQAFSLGACLPCGIYLDAVNAKQVQMLASAVDFLAMDATDLPVRSETALTLSEICESLTGSFQVYNLRVVLETDDLSLLSAQARELNILEITNVQFLNEISPEVLAEAAAGEEEPVPQETDTAETTPHYNPYATVSPGSSMTDDTPAETEPEETYYRSEGGSWY